jgi:Bacterial archaeo-eukaryotic release factor family 3
MKREILEKLAFEISSPCVTISMNTHRTSPDNLQDIVGLKNLLKEAHDRVINEFGKRPVSDLLEKNDNLEKEIDVNYNLDSLYIFLSNSTKEIVKSPWPTLQNTVHVSENFAIKPLIKIFNRTEEYLILVLSQSGVRLFHAINDSIAGEIRNDDFPLAKNPHVLTDHDKLSDGKKVDNMVREFFNTVDKAVVRVHNKTDMKCVVICTEANYSRLMQVADVPSIYLGHASINYNNTANHTIANDAWQIVKEFQKQTRTIAIKEMQEAAGQGKVITDLSEILRAVKEGRGDLLITYDDYHQSIVMTGEYTFDIVNDVTLPGAIDDISSDIAWEVISKKGRAIFTSQEEIKSLGGIALKVRY